MVKEPRSSRNLTQPTPKATSPSRSSADRRSQSKDATEKRPRGRLTANQERKLRARERELSAAEQRLEKKRAELDARERTIVDRIAALDRQKQTYTLLQHHLDAQKRQQRAEAEIKSRGLALREARYRRKARELSRHEKQYAAKERALQAETSKRLEAMVETERKLKLRIGTLEDERDKAVRTKKWFRTRTRTLEGERGALVEEATRTEERLKTQIRALEKERDALTRNKRRLEEANRSLEDQVADMDRKSAAQSAKIAAQSSEIATLSASVASAGPLAIGNPVVRDWLAEGPLSDEFVASTDCVVLGSGPWSAAEFDGHLRTQGHTTCAPGNGDAEIMIVGCDGWTELGIDKQLEAREGRTLRVYSQEMFFLAMATGRDPFDGDRALLQAFGKGHPALEYLMETSLNWPAVAVTVLEDIDFSDFESSGYVSETPLRSLGYRVGTYGLASTRRRKILTRAFQSDLPYVESKDYMQQWGSNGSRKRLARTAHHIAWLARLHHTNPSMTTAVGDWESDLAWLKRTFYKRWMRFKWPTVRV